jgi:hypothetical protein
MADKKYSLTKPESDRIGNLLSVARIQEEILNSVTLTYKAYLLESVFPRLGIDPEMFALSAINLQEGELVIKESDESVKDKKKP